MAEDAVGAVGQPKGVSVIGYSVTANIDGHRQMVFQHFVAQDASDDEVNRDLDRIMRLVDRQRAIYELPELQEELLKLSDEISQYTEDQVIQAEVNYNRAQAELQVQLETLEGDRRKAYEEAYAAFKRSGRTGEFKPKGHVENALTRLDAGIKQLRDAMSKNEAERGFFVTNTEGNIQRRRDRIALLEEKIAQREKVAT